MLELALLAALAAAPVEPLSFQQAVDRAVAQHPAMRLADQDVARALALLEQARAPSLPTLSAGLTYTRLDAERRLNDRLAAGQDQLAGNLTLTVPLVNTPKWAQWRRSQDSAEAVKLTAADVKRQVALGAGRAWLSVLAQQRVLEAATRARDTASAHLDFARGRSAGGVGNRLEELRAAQELAVSQTQVALARGQLVRLQEALGVWVAADGAVEVSMEEPALDAPVRQEDALVGLDSARRDVKAARARATFARAATGLDWMDYAPLLSAVVQPFTQNPPSLVQPQLGWQAQAVLAIPLYEGGLRYGQAHEREALARTAELQLEAALRQARSEVRVAFSGVRHADEVLVAAGDAAKQAQDALELATASWKAGASTNLEVIDAERRARDAQTQAALAEDTARQARLDLLAASGKFP